MNEELQQALADLVNKSVEMGGNAIAFTKEQLPEVIQQLLIWKLAANAIVLVIAIILLLLACKLARYIFKSKPADGGDDTLFWTGRSWRAGEMEFSEVSIICTIASVFVVPGGVIAALVAGSQALQIWLAPKVYLIEYAASLAK